MPGATTLNLVLYLPLIAALVLAFIPRDQHNAFKFGALGASFLTLVVSLGMLPDFKQSDNATYQLVTDVTWIAKFGVHYKVGVDGISLVLILLTTFLSVIAILSSFESIRERVKEYYIFLLLLETGMLGVFAGLDLIVFYIFWEAMLIPMYFLIGIWGGPNRLYATFKFVLYTLVGSLLMLVAIVWLYSVAAQAGQPTFDIEALTGPNSPVMNSPALPALPEAARLWFTNPRFWLFLAFALAFAIKVPMFPFHTWLPDAHVQAPTAGSVILAGVLLKMGTYGFLRFCIPLFPDVAVKLAPWFMGLAVIGIIYGALMAYVQTDVKSLVAYSSVSHLGFCMLGLFAFTREGVAGSVLQMLNHGLSTGALFLLVGMIYDRRHTRQISEFGGLWKVLPVFTAFFLITTLSSVGLPGLNGFVGEFMILIGSWAPIPLPNAQWPAVLGATGVILGAVYMMWMFQRMFQGPLDNPENQKLHDLNLREWGVILPLIILMFWIGVQPSPTLAMFDQAINRNVVEPVRNAALGRMGGPPGVPGGGLPPGFQLPPGLNLPGGAPGGTTLPGGGGIPGGAGTHP